MRGRLTAALVLLVACSEATDGVIAGPWNPPYDDAADATDGGAVATKKDASASTDGAVVTASPVLLNELSAGSEWVELVNSGPDPIDLGGYLVADQDKDTLGPKAKDGVTFDPGTTLAPGEYGIVQGGELDAGCPSGGQAFCAHAAFGISKKNGETIYLLGPDAGILGTMVFPPSPDIQKTQSWCRLADADPQGQFQLCTATPGAVNTP